MSEKIVIYQALVRLFGNTNTTNKPWGSKEENGVGKFADFTDKALAGIKELGVTHVWYTGVLHHATTSDYTAIGVDNDNPAVVKGRAGSPYAVKDYYNVDPDLTEEPANRLEEFKALVARTHKAGLKVIIDIVPNHVARHYKSTSKPTGVKDFGEEDDTSVTYAHDNNFYYNPNEAFVLPEGVWGSYEEYPAKWTGNDCRASQPSITDWYETVKLNYGIRPDGVEDFDPIPDTWQKMRDIALYWLAMGVDGFRFDMAEMVPVAFWHYLNCTIKAQYPEAMLIAEVYTPQLYRAYLHEGKMDYLYDKVQLYDSLRAIVSEGASTDSIAPIQRDLADIAPAMLHFLENHDEQRIASPEFAGNPWKAVPAMAVSTLISDAPVMLYFGQEVGERAADWAGFGSPSRTSIFDYIGVPAHQRWVNNKQFDGGQLSEAEQALRDFYCRLLNLKVSGAYFDLHEHNRAYTPYYNDKVYTFMRIDEGAQWLIAVNFAQYDHFGFDLQLPPYIIGSCFLNDGVYPLQEELYGTNTTTLVVENGIGLVRIELAPLQTLVLKITE